VSFAERTGGRNRRGGAKDGALVCLRNYCDEEKKNRINERGTGFSKVGEVKRERIADGKVGRDQQKAGWDNGGKGNNGILRKPGNLRKMTPGQWNRKKKKTNLKASSSLEDREAEGQKTSEIAVHLPSPRLKRGAGRPVVSL